MKKARKTTKRTAAQGNVLTTLPVAMTGRASPAKAAVGDTPVFAYISSFCPPAAIARCPCENVCVVDEDSGV
jgi:hypothetical protein